MKVTYFDNNTVVLSDKEVTFKFNFSTNVFVFNVPYKQCQEVITGFKGILNKKTDKVIQFHDDEGNSLLTLLEYNSVDENHVGFKFMAKKERVIKETREFFKDLDVDNMNITKLVDNRYHILTT